MTVAGAHVGSVVPQFDVFPAKLFFTSLVRVSVAGPGAPIKLGLALLF